LCLRVRQRGWVLLRAQDVYVHHHGSVSFRGLGIDVEQQLGDNLANFRDKWGPAHAAGYRPPPGTGGSPVVFIRQASRLYHGAHRCLAMTVRNEDHKWRASEALGLAA
jgi:hypothetical protein